MRHDRAMRSRTLCAVALVAAALGVVGCGGDDDDAAPDPTVPPGAVAFYGDEFSFEPMNATIEGGDVEIAFVNRGRSMHTLVIVDAAGTMIGERLRVDVEGDVDTGTFHLEPGVYTVVCDVIGHASEGMITQLTVT